jgi:hypothetical protein
MSHQDDHDRDAEVRRLRGDATTPRPPSAVPIGLLVVLVAVLVGTFAFFRMRAIATPGSAVEIPRKAGPDPEEPAGPGHGGVVPDGPSALPANSGDGGT